TLNFCKLQFLKLVNSSVDFYFSSKCELPEADTNIKILFDCLDLSIIIKLWSCILLERQIIIIANQNFLLFSICEALLKLLFPFKWLYPYIPVLPKNLFGFLD